MDILAWYKETLNIDSLTDIYGNPVPSPSYGDPTKADIGAVEKSKGQIIPMIMQYYRKRRIQ